MQMIKRFITACIVLVTTLWGSAAIFFGDSQSSLSQLCLAYSFALLGATTLIGLSFTKWRKRLLLGHISVFAIVLTWWWFSVAPSNGRVWQKDAEKLANATFSGDQVTVNNIRNFDYRSEFDYQPAYYSKTFDLNKLEGVDLFSIYWMGPAIAHTILSFHFGGNNYLAISIEARKELNEGYSTIKGFFRQYELIYFVADERDLIRLRTNYRKNPPEQVYQYRLQGSTIENAKDLFLRYMHKINELNQKPEFYNTLLDNCTTGIWFLTLDSHEHVPFSWKLLLSGYVPEYLYEQGRLDTSVPFSELTKQAYINDLAKAADQASEFSTRIRTSDRGQRDAR